METTEEKQEDIDVLMTTEKVKVQGNNCVGSISSPEAWSLSHWNGDAAALRDRLAGMLISEDVHRHICMI
ncbi:unnamed protein product [Peronospora effusa]|uniref:Uncharacterized protein n=1 Tax=Peronospora effusa TaxID=542832 RepID=A0A3M6VT29_9STRA|nr:hypothetical protein DD238_005952 [Peronospora effusa]RQM17947.1 hypothetical protein DD237_002639 [Peronospora effusa]CAI5729090.1 unnamed protein product [Peronospora effusa]